MAGIEREKEMGQGNHAYSREALSPLAPDTQVMMVLKGRLHEMDYRGTLCHREVSLFRLEVHKRNAI